METALYTYREFTFDSVAEGQKIFTRVYEPKGEKKAILQIVHGMAEHTGLYKEFCEFLAENGEKEDIRLNLMYDKVYQFLADNAEVTEQ